MSIIKTDVSTKWFPEMKKNMLKLERLPILRLLLLKREILGKFENFTGFPWLGGKP